MNNENICSVRIWKHAVLPLPIYKAETVAERQKKNQHKNSRRREVLEK